MEPTDTPDETTTDTNALGVAAGIFAVIGVIAVVQYPVRKLEKWWFNRRYEKFLDAKLAEKNSK